MRSFIAIPIDAACSRMLEGVQQKLQEQHGAEQVVWFLPENFHLTLHFLGANVPEEKIEQVIQAMDSWFANGFPCFEVELDRVELFPSGPYPHTIVVSVQNNTQLQRLFSSLEAYLATLGLEGKKRDFLPHISLGRIKVRCKQPSMHIPEQLAVIKMPMLVDRITLFESELTLREPIYTPLKNHYFV
ncbi:MULTISPECIES: RNA 2',3'-cyclic phosphodiesterase [Thiomicrorhabdus]|uniref:RNA 2',3'-cyclic phosphodiesterase n=1 Tax=Thiomicrorhabdus heinhorstiae TaxID=2748010 RepID=A0ABS0BSD2_9GAMM|nr:MULTISPECIES: RNA 2',3'-cyclic phosphodiesterase [Thiomicrorhabdus]MBF6056786.1 RNA 2',3'-cyclic phosphodiesterase [Thiomicrorhabdus heinhorstiae]